MSVKYGMLFLFLLSIWLIDNSQRKLFCYNLKNAIICFITYMLHFLLSSVTLLVSVKLTGDSCLLRNKKCLRLYTTKKTKWEWHQCSLKQFKDGLNLQEKLQVSCNVGAENSENKYLRICPQLWLFETTKR